MWNWIRKNALKTREATVANATAETTTADTTGETPHAKPRPGMVSGKYLSLYKYLEHRYADITVLTFAQIEDLLGFALPQLARTQQAWWTIGVADGDTPPHAAAWLEAGRTATANLLAQTVSFSRTPSIKGGLA
jgi:hypothetical protein